MKISIKLRVFSDRLFERCHGGGKHRGVDGKEGGGGGGEGRGQQLGGGNSAVAGGQ